jgi:hypothetical protein
VDLMPVAMVPRVEKQSLEELSQRLPRGRPGRFSHLLYPVQHIEFIGMGENSEANRRTNCDDNWICSTLDHFTIRNNDHVLSKTRRYAADFMIQDDPGDVD